MLGAIWCSLGASRDAGWYWEGPKYTRDIFTVSGGTQLTPGTVPEAGTDLE